MDERMEAIMRKLTAMALSMMFILGSVIPVGAEETQIRQTKISVSIDPVYTVTIPANTTIERGEQSVKRCCANLNNSIMFSCCKRMLQFYISYSFSRFNHI